MYIMIKDIIGKKTIDLSYSVRSRKEITVITMLSDNIQYEIVEPRTIMDPILSNK